jgi:hypothetical protein
MRTGVARAVMSGVGDEWGASNTVYMAMSGMGKNGRGGQQRTGRLVTRGRASTSRAGSIGRDGQQGRAAEAGGRAGSGKWGAGTATRGVGSRQRVADASERTTEWEAIIGQRVVCAATRSARRRRRASQVYEAEASSRVNTCRNCRSAAA